MIELRLSAEQVRVLEGLIRAAMQSAGPFQREELAALHSALVQAHQVATEQQARCAWCGRLFDGGSGQRQALYCSPACKQAAYRQRVRDRKRQFGPRRL